MTEPGFGAVLLGIMATHNLSIKDVADLLGLPNIIIHNRLCEQSPKGDHHTYLLMLRAQVLNMRSQATSTTLGLDIERPIRP